MHVSIHPSINYQDVQQNFVACGKHIGGKEKEWTKGAAHTQKSILDSWLHVRLLRIGYDHTNGEKQVDCTTST